MKKILIATVVAMCAASPAAWADDRVCTSAPRAEWQSLEQVSAKLTEQGYTVTKIEYDDGCVEADVRDKSGRYQELYLDPVSGAIVGHDD